MSCAKICTHLGNLDRFPDRSFCISLACKRNHLALDDDQKACERRRSGSNRDLCWHSGNIVFCNGIDRKESAQLISNSERATSEESYL